MFPQTQDGTRNRPRLAVGLCTGFQVGLCSLFWELVRLSIPGGLWTTHDYSHVLGLITPSLLSFPKTNICSKHLAQKCAPLHQACTVDLFCWCWSRGFWALPLPLWCTWLCLALFWPSPHFHSYRKKSLNTSHLHLNYLVYKALQSHWNECVGVEAQRIHFDRCLPVHPPCLSSHMPLTFGR